MSIHEYARRERQRTPRTYRVTLACGNTTVRVRVDHCRHVQDAVRQAQGACPGWTALVAEEV